MSEDIFDIEKLKTQIKNLESEMAKPDFWKKKNAKQKSQEFSQLQQTVLKWESIQALINDLIQIAELDQKDQSVNLRQDIEKQFVNLEKKLNHFEQITFLGEKYDKKNVLFSIFSGAGGVDAQDWAEMLLRMYLRYAEKRGWKTRIINKSVGTEAGIKSISIEIQGEYVYGFLKSEAGVHRLVRISPFDAEKMRHTSFALVDVLPKIDDVKIDINQDDLRIDTFLSSGPGGQNLQKTESAVRIVHKPTSIIAVCQSERSQHQNKEKAMDILKTKLYHYYLAEKQEEKARIKGEFKSASWGNQIRSYVLYPYKIVKDLRTRYETVEVRKVLDGDIDELIEGYLKFKQK